MSDTFVQAAYDGDLDAVESFLQQGVDVDYADPKGWTALNAAIQASVSPEHAGDPKGVARCLIDAGADLGIPSPDGWRPLVKAAAWSAYMSDLLSFLLDHGDAWHGPEDWKGINYAASWRGDAGIRLLCANGADPDTRDADGRTPLMRAAKKGHKPTVQALLELGADPNQTDPDGRTPLMYAAAKPVADNVRAMLEHGADPRLTDAAGRTALDHAKDAGKPKIVAVLEGLDRQNAG